MTYDHIWPPTRTSPGRVNMCGKPSRNSRIFHRIFRWRFRVMNQYQRRIFLETNGPTQLNGSIKVCPLANFWIWGGELDGAIFTDLFYPTYDLNVLLPGSMAHAIWPTTIWHVSGWLPHFQTHSNSFISGPSGPLNSQLVRSAFQPWRFQPCCSSTERARHFGRRPATRWFTDTGPKLMPQMLPFGEHSPAKTTMSDQQTRHGVMTSIAVTKIARGRVKHRSNYTGWWFGTSILFSH